MEKYKGVVMLAAPPIDKIAAKVLLERRFGAALPVSEFYETTECDPALMIQWDLLGLVPIDIGHEKYHRLGAPSATQAVAERFSIKPTEGLKKLFDLLADNNRTGKLKNQHMAIAWTLREMYELPGYDHRDVVERAGHAIHAWLDAQDGKAVDGRTDEALAAALPELVAVTVKCNWAPFTPAGYLRDLWRLGYPTDEIGDRVGYWLEGYRKAQDAQTAAKAEYAAIQGGWFQAAGLKCRRIETDSPFVVRSASRDCDVLLTRSSRGNAAVLTRKLNVSALATEILRLEPDRWYHHHATGHILNGGKIYKKVTPTELWEQLPGLIQRHPPRK